MKVRSLFGTILAACVVCTFASGTGFAATKDMSVSDEKLYYVVKSQDSFDNRDGVSILNENEGKYLENYTIEFFSAKDSPSLKAAYYNTDVSQLMLQRKLQSLLTHVKLIRIHS